MGKVNTNLIVQGGWPILDETYKAGDTSLKPGYLAKKGADDETLVDAGANAKLGLGIVDIIASRGQEVGTALASGDPVKLAKGAFFFLVTIKENQTIVAGDDLIYAGAGLWEKAADLVIAAGATAVTSAAANGAGTITGSKSATAVVYAIAEESVTTAGEENKTILGRYIK